MSQSNDIEQLVPEWDTADRMRKSLRVSEVGVQEIADYLGVSRNTVGTWINGRIEPSTQTKRLWALRTGVPYGWLNGETPAGPKGPDGGDALCAIRDSNPEPAGLESGPTATVADLGERRTRPVVTPVEREPLAVPA